MKTPEELANEEKIAKAKRDKVRVKEITTIIDETMEIAMDGGKVNSKGGKIQYPVGKFFRDYEVGIVEEHLNKYHWTCTYDPKEDKVKQTTGGEKAYTQHFFNIKPLPKSKREK